MKSVGIAVFAAMLAGGFSSNADAAQSCSFSAGAVLDAASPSKVGTMTCQVEVYPGKVMSRSYAVTVNWGSDPFTTGGAAGVTVQLNNNGASQSLGASAIAAPATVTPGTIVKLNDVNGNLVSNTFNVNFKYVVGGRATTVQFKVDNLTARVN